MGNHQGSWHGVALEPKTREDPHHASNARLRRMEERFLLALKVIFWIVVGLAYFAVIAGVAVVIAVSISITFSLGIKPLRAGLILKPGLTPRQGSVAYTHMSSRASSRSKGRSAGCSLCVASLDR